MTETIKSIDVSGITATLPPFPQVVLRMLDSLENAGLSIDELVQIAQTDSVLTSAILSAVNRSLRIRAQPDTCDLFAAASLIGFDRVRKVVLIAGVNRFMGDLCMKHQHLYEHSLAVGIIAQELASISRFSPDEAFVAGILHDIGHLGFLAFDRVGYSKMVNDGNYPLNMLQMESEKYSMDHCQLGLLMGGYWGLPKNILRAIGFHHRDVDPVTDKLLLIISLAESICRGLDIPNSSSNRVLNFDSWAFEYLGIDWGDSCVEDCLARSRARFDFMVRHSGSA